MVLAVSDSGEKKKSKRVKGRGLEKKPHDNVPRSLSRVDWKCLSPFARPRESIYDLGFFFLFLYFSLSTLLPLLFVPHVTRHPGFSRSDRLARVFPTPKSSFLSRTLRSVVRKLANSFPLSLFSLSCFFSEAPGLLGVSVERPSSE